MKVNEYRVQVDFVTRDLGEAQAIMNLIVQAGQTVSFTRTEFEETAKPAKTTKLASAPMPKPQEPEGILRWRQTRAVLKGLLEIGRPCTAREIGELSSWPFAQSTAGGALGTLFSRTKGLIDREAIQSISGTVYQYQIVNLERVKAIVGLD